MHIAIVPHSIQSHGGSYQYSLILLDALAAASKQEPRDQYTLFVRSRDQFNSLKEYGRQWNNEKLRLPIRQKLLALLDSSHIAWLRDSAIRTAHHLMPQKFNEPTRIWPNWTTGNFFHSRGIDWVLYLAPTTLAFESGLPYVMPVYDLQHRIQPEFEEVSAYGQWNRREYLYRNGTCHATLILADSEVGKEDILNFYGPFGITEDRVKVLPYVPAPYLSRNISQDERSLVRHVYRLPERYLFYPAHLWPHKNHIRIVTAMAQVKESRGIEIHLVLCGDYRGKIRTQIFRELNQEIDRLHLSKQVHYLGYVPNNAMAVLYAEADGLVMPTFFGPTNIPVSEAWLLGCPVLTSDIRGIREQVGDAGLLVDPRSVEAIADGIRRLWEDERLRADLARRGTQRLAAHRHEDFCARLAEIIEEASHRVTKQSSSRNHIMVPA